MAFSKSSKESANKNKSKHNDLHEDLVCFHCDFQTNQKGTMDQHILKVHSRDTVEVCPKWPHCQFQTTQKAALDNHIQTVHLKMKMQSLQPVKIEPTKQITKKEVHGSNHSNEPSKNDNQMSGPMTPISTSNGNAQLPLDIKLPVPTHMLPQHLLPQNLVPKDRRNKPARRRVTAKMEQRMAKNRIAKEERLKRIKEERLVERQKKRQIMKERRDKRKQEILPCPYSECTYENTKNNLHYHVKAVHKKIKDAACKFCEYKAYYPCQIKKHEKNCHSEAKDLSCIYCEFKTNHRQSLSTHIKALHIKKKDLFCPECTFETSHKSALFHHLKMGIHQPVKDVQCQHCNFQTSRQTLLEKHLIKVHPKLKMVACQFCGEQTSHFDAKAHFEEKHKKEKDLTCDQCDFSTHFKNNLEKHVKVIHEKVKDFVCPKKCGFVTAHPSSLKKHMNKKQCLSSRTELARCNNDGVKCPVGGCSYMTHCKGSTQVKCVMKKHLRKAHHIMKNVDKFYSELKSLEEIVKIEEGEEENIENEDSEDNVGTDLKRESKAELKNEETNEDFENSKQENFDDINRADKSSAAYLQLTMPFNKQEEVRDMVEYYKSTDAEMQEAFLKPIGKLSNMTPLVST